MATHHLSGCQLKVRRTIAAAVFAGCSVAHADTIGGNLLPGDGYSVSGGVFGWQGGGIQADRAISFTTPTDVTYVFTRLSVAIEINASLATTDSIQVNLAQDAGGVPGAVVETLNVNMANAFALYSADSVLRPTLLPGTRYWIVAPGAPTNRELIWRWAGVHSTTNQVAARTTVSGVAGPWTVLSEAAARGAFKVEGEAAGGACCTRDSLCAVTTPAQCQALGLTFIGHGSTCGPLACGLVLPNGACCQSSVCTITSVLGCGAVVGGGGGVFLGAGTTCSPVTVRGRVNPCCPADFNNSGEASVQDLFDFLATFFAGCP